MKKILLGLGLAILASVSLQSCSKGEYNSGDLQTGKNPFSDENNKPKVPTNGTFTAKINGVDFSADPEKCWIYSDTASKIWVIYAFKGNGVLPETFSLITEKTEKGIYDINYRDFNATASGIYTSEGTLLGVSAQTGKVEISEITEKKEGDITKRRVKGKFDMQAPGFDVTEGNFDLPVIDYKK